MRIPATLRKPPPKTSGELQAGLIRRKFIYGARQPSLGGREYIFQFAFVMGQFAVGKECQRRAFIKAWGTAPGIRSPTFGQG
jgi:hypothetical protein